MSSCCRPCRRSHRSRSGCGCRTRSLPHAAVCWPVSGVRVAVPPGPGVLSHRLGSLAPSMEKAGRRSLTAWRSRSATRRTQDCLARLRRRWRRFYRRLGLNAVLDGEARVLDAVAWVAPHLGVLRATASFDGASTLVSRFRASSALADLLSAGYAVVADLPPLPPAGAADRVAGMFDTVVLVVRAGVTSLDAVRASLKFLDQEPVVILNGTKSSVPRWLASGEGS